MVASANSHILQYILHKYNVRLFVIPKICKSYLLLIVETKPGHFDPMVFAQSLELICCSMSFVLHGYFDLLNSWLQKYKLHSCSWTERALLSSSKWRYHPLNNGNNDFKVMSTFEPLWNKTSQMKFHSTLHFHNITGHIDFKSLRITKDHLLLRSL